MSYCIIIDAANYCHSTIIIESTLYSQWCCQSRNNWVKKPYQAFLIPIFPNPGPTLLLLFSSTQAQFCTNPIQPNSPLDLNIYIYFISWANKIHKSPTSYPKVHFTNPSYKNTTKPYLLYLFNPNIPEPIPTLFFCFFGSSVQPRLNFVQTQFRPNSPLGLNKPLVHFMGQQNPHLDMAFIRIGCEKLTLVNLSVKNTI